MASHINFDAKSDRELLLLTAQSMNVLSEEKFPDVQCRLTELEKECKRRGETCPGYVSVYQRRRAFITGAGVSGGGLTIIYIIAKAIAAYYGVTL